jgi:hypothetical protein
LYTIHKVKLCFIQNQYKPICANCKFYIPNKNECSKFGDLNIITGKYNYDSATNVRNDKNKCGEYAIFYKKNNFKFITIPYYYILENSEIIILLSYGFLPTILWFIIFMK